MSSPSARRRGTDGAVVTGWNGARSTRRRGRGEGAGRGVASSPKAGLPVAGMLMDRVSRLLGPAQGGEGIFLEGRVSEFGIGNGGRAKRTPKVPPTSGLSDHVKGAIPANRCSRMDLPTLTSASRPAVGPIGPASSVFLRLASPVCLCICDCFPVQSFYLS